jgi:hypothetical protein
MDHSTALNLIAAWLLCQLTITRSAIDLFTYVPDHIMNGLPGAAIAIAIIDISVKIILLCFQNSRAVKDANIYIKRVQKRLSDIAQILEQIEQLSNHLY